MTYLQNHVNYVNEYIVVYTQVHESGKDNMYAHNNYAKGNPLGMSLKGGIPDSI